ncbi:hypothetical protein B0T16DRAFT_425073 [Cercophora newfieldiana]|uniref:Secondary alcohol dehydrogenase n=1 Tax=Cercophora newfieldiana TaxID=92897 RepID=A0AA39YRQ6_9PEZI|nr:hypothetical protein B0T16DRAFT_425073 [Cercophora newfieldiana]
MSSETLPISPTAFSAALKDLPLSTLHIKVLELRNSITHLDYSNEQLRPFALGTSTSLGTPPSQPDQDCIDAIRENEAVIARMQERIQLVRAEVEERGQSWEEFKSEGEVEADAKEGEEVVVNGTAAAAANGVNGNGHAAEERHSAWTDGTFQTGVIRGGQVHMDATAGSRTGGSLTELRRRMEELRGLGDGQDDDDEGGLHL